MVNKDFLENLNAVLRMVSERQGVAYHEVKNLVDNICVLDYPRELANRQPGAVHAIANTLMHVSGVTDIYEEFEDEPIRGTDRKRIEIEVADQHWKATEADAAYWRLDDARTTEGTPEYEAFQAERKRMRRKYYRDYLLPVPKRNPNAPDVAYLVMSYEPYDLIESGKKRTEFRAYSEYYLKKLVAGAPHYIRFQRGYGGPGRPAPKQMVWTVKKIDLYSREERKSCDPYHIPVGFIPEFVAVDLGTRVS